jgi:hypothetical protein
MSEQVRIVGSFADEEQCAEVIEHLRHQGLGKVEAFTPFPSERINEAMELKRSPVRRWVLGGGITGVLSGFALTVGTSYTYPHHVGGKSLSSIPPYVIIAFELMILFGALSGVLGFLVNGRFPRFESVPSYLPRFSSDRFGVVVTCEAAEAERAEAMLKEAGAEEVHRESV